MAKNQTGKVQIITSGSMAANVTSSVVNISFLDNVAVQLNFTGTPTGTFAVQGSADYAADYLGNVINAGNWVGITLNPAPIASGAADQILIDMNQLSFPFLRVVYTRASGTGTLNGFVSGKGV